MTTKHWKALVALAAGAVIAGSAIAGCGGSGNANIGSSGGAAGADGGGTGGGGGSGNTGNSGGTGGNTGGTAGTSDAGPCSGTEQQCSGSCVDTQADNNNCGSCGNVCGGGSSCQAGKCTCAQGDLCSGACVDTQTDNGNCGSCGNACSGGKTCSAGKCACGSNETDCSGTCVNTDTDFNNCGGCAKPCSTGQVCSGGVCGNTCSGNTTNCGGSCVDTTKDKSHCGDCATACSATKETCVSSKCTCPNNGTVCGGACVDTQTNSSHCGDCATVCSGGATCKAGKCAKAAQCGDGIVDTGEECDDGNTSSLDGCDKSCKYEVFTRMDKVTIQRGTAPSYCAHTKNAMGNALTTTGASNMNKSLQSDIDAGTTNIIVQALGLDDLTGVSDSALQLGATNGKPDPAKGTFNGSQIDWWYQLNSTTLDLNGVPTSLISPAAIANRALTAGPSNIQLLLSLGGSNAVLEMLHSRIHASMGSTTSQPKPPPDANQLQTGLKVFETIDATNGGQGLCGDTTVESLAQIPAPQSLSKGGSTACGKCKGSHTYTYCGVGKPVSASCNSLLDVFVGGCKVVACLVGAVSPTQPDVAGNGSGSLTLDSNNKVQQTTKGNTNAYSSWMQFHAQRVHVTGTY
jgi:hypothetical protein